MESKFLTNLVVEKYNEDKWILMESLIYRSRLLQKRITVPMGFVTDFASVPRIPILYSWFGDRAHRESVIHDYLYQTHLFDRLTADAVFLEAMKARKKNILLRNAMFLGVRFGGMRAYDTGIKRAEKWA